MKSTRSTIILIFLLILNSNLSFSQNFKMVGNNNLDNTSSDNKKLFNGQWAGFDIGFISTNMSDEWSNKIMQSTTFGLNLYEYKLPIIRQYLGITTGLGFNFKTFTFGDDYSLVSTDTSVALDTGNPLLYDTNSTVKTSQLNQIFFQIPLLLDFSTKVKQKRALSLAAGVVGGILLSTNHKLNGKYSNGDKFQNVIKDDNRFHTNLLSLEGMVRLAYGPFGLYGTYSLTSLFKKDATKEIMPFSIGISFNIDYGKEKEEITTTEETEDGNI